ncbi:hypothetical protein LTR70_010586 [Exophiala xenobiotica]|uniref:Peptidase A1 domain-containing protein n=1 Tax=Lithohypha guttulata TaxID=1690604 RepID=A0ABR0JTB5_9EURO|nr:hypothetical protein LTR24_010615 [Lithohypha guttulata]KAK5309126.1 hypothetical protein LTR70_010586 [Exophiala xenobiotica]
MHQLQTWLLLLVSFSSYVSAFYPYQKHHDSTALNSGNEKRFYPVQRPYTSTPDSTRVVKLDLHKVPKQKRENKFSVSLSNAADFGPNSLSIDQDGSDYSYFSTMQFGSKGQEMYMLIDTGSANTWVFSSDCEATTCSIHNTFGKEDSTTLEATTEPWDLSYGTGDVSGVVATDTLAFANFTVQMGFGLAVNASDDFNNYPMDGILGLGRRTSDQLGTPTIMDILSADKLISSNKIGVHLHRAEDGTKDGEIVFGGIDTDKFSGTLSYTETSNNDAWEIPVQDMLVNGQPCNFTDRTAIIDTGTTFILMPPADAAALHDLIPGSATSGEGFTLPCSTTVKLEVSINGKLYAVSPKDYIGNPTSSGSSTCGSTIIGHQAFGDQQWILGDVFLKNVYAVFDFDGKQIGFGMPGNSGSASSSSAPSSSTTAAASSSETARVSASASASAIGSGSVSTTGSGASASNTGARDSNLGEGTSGAAGRTVVGYWKIGFSICVGVWLGLLLL